MSTILNSLKKSSDERNENNKSSMDNFTFGSANNSSKSQSFIVILLLVTLTVVISYFGYQYLYSQDEITQTEISMPQEEQHDATAKAMNSDESGEVSREKIQKPNSDDVKQKIKDTLDTEKTKVPSTPVLVEKQIIDDAVGIGVQSETSNAKKQSGKSNTSVTQASQVQKKPVLTLTTPDEIENQTAITPVKKQKYLYVYQLPFSVRKDIPEIKLNIHVFDKDPENRIAIINGVKLSVGDFIENEILLKDIIQEGILLEFNDNEFMIPK